MKLLQVERVEVFKIVDTVDAFSPKVLFVDRRREDFEPHRHWLAPHFIDAELRMVLSVHSFVVRTPQHTVVIDTCVGNDKKDGGFPQWNLRQGDYLERFRAHGFALEEVDYVFCTHLHVDHVGWNTRLVDGRWQPTFPRARYLFHKGEWEHWRQEAAAGSAFDAAILSQSVTPVFEAGQVDLLTTADGYAIDDFIQLRATPGHTPGHCAVHLRDGAAEARITGDLMIHPVQIADPGWQQKADWDRALALRTRRQFLESCCDRDIHVLGTHFHGPTAVHIVENQGEMRPHWKA